MPRKKSSEQRPNTNGRSSNTGETVAGYFRKVFAENPKLLTERSNDEIYRRWLADHPGHSEVPKTVKSNLQNLKSVLRKGLPKSGHRKAEGTQPAQQAQGARLSRRQLEVLENRIDDVFQAARSVEGLEGIVALLRQARNDVIRKAERLG